MHGGKLILGIALAAVVLLSGVFIFMPSVRPGFVQKWFEKATGFTDAKSPEDALDKFKQAIEKRDYKIASKYLVAGGADSASNYKEWFVKGSDDASVLHEEIENLRAAMKDHGVKSPKGQFVLYMLEPFPTGFTFSTPKVSGDTATATLDWTETRRNHAGEVISGWQVDSRIWHSLLPYALDQLTQLPVTVVKEKDGFWRIQIPTESRGRRVADTVDYLRKNGTNFRNAVQSLKTDVKNDSATREKVGFENALKTKLEGTK